VQIKGFNQLSDIPKTSNATFDMDVPVAEIHVVEPQHSPFRGMAKNTGTTEFYHGWVNADLKTSQSATFNLIDGVIVTKDIDLIAVLDSLPQFRRALNNSDYTHFEKINGC
jgi:hypothetical protein